MRARVSRHRPSPLAPKDDPKIAVPQLLGIAIELDTAEGWHRPGPVLGDAHLASTRLGERFAGPRQDADEAVEQAGQGVRDYVSGANPRPIKTLAITRLPLSVGWV